MTIIIPMAGLSSRFLKAGYTLPKYMLYAGGRSLFNLAVSSFREYFDTARFVFVARNVWSTREFIEAECALMGVRDHTEVMLDHPTRGQAETVALGITAAEVAADEPVLIFNIDTFRPGFRFPQCVADGCDGYLEVFKGEGDNWSYAECLPGTDRVVRTAEKRRISDNCSTGIYYFRRADMFLTAYGDGECWSDNNIPELYVAPLYNRLIADCADIRIDIIPRSAVTFCGVPAEYDTYLNTVINNG